MAQDNKFRDALLERLSLAEVISRRVKLKKRGREYLGLCPFHKEKTPSFTVVEDKGFYHCFGCGASGNAISFVMETENVGYPEALTSLAATVGMKVPEYRPKDPQEQKRLDDEYQLMQKTSDYFATQLYGDDGKRALDYLQKRGLDNNDIKKFGLGYAPADSQALQNGAFASADKAVLESLDNLSLIRTSERDGSRYGFFRDRIMFPIHDRKGRIIAFGGRYMGQNKEVGKYINSADHELFHKGENLYNLHRAQATIKDSGALIVGEGYMDVIALDKHGFTAVAPLGTALTELQLRMLWRLHPTPIMAFDGDNAGRSAAYRAALRALPLLTARHSLKFLFMPEGEDPDSFLQKHGRTDFAERLKEAQNMEDFLWDAELARQPLGNFAQKADFRDRLMQIGRQIEDSELRRIYSDGFREKLFHHFRLTFKKEAGKQKIAKPNLPSVVQMEWAGLIFMAARFPQVLDEFEYDLHGLADKSLDKLLKDLQIYCLSGQASDLQSLSEYMQESESADLWQRMLGAANMRLAHIAKARKLFETEDHDDNQSGEISEMLKTLLTATQELVAQQQLDEELRRDIRQGEKDTLIDGKFKARNQVIKASDIAHSD